MKTKYYYLVLLWFVITVVGIIYGALPMLNIANTLINLSALFAILTWFVITWKTLFFTRNPFKLNKNKTNETV